VAKAAENPRPRDIEEILKAARQDARREAIRRLLPKLCSIVVAVGLLNFILFLAGAFYLGGDAWNGKVEGHKYYVWGYHLGQKGYTEVSRAAFDYSRWHVYSVMVTWPLAIVAGVIGGRMVRPSEP
jgi:hypothetical protein